MVNGKNLFGKRLRVAREKAGLSQRKLGLAAGMDIATADVRISQYELGVHMPIFETATKIAKALGVPISYLYETDTNIAEAILNLGRLTVQQQKKIIKQTKNLAKK